MPSGRASAAKALTAGLLALLAALMAAGVCLIFDDAAGDTRAVVVPSAARPGSRVVVRYRPGQQGVVVLIEMDVDPRWAEVSYEISSSSGAVPGLVGHVSGSAGDVLTVTVGAVGQIAQREEVEVWDLARSFTVRVEGDGHQRVDGFGQARIPGSWRLTSFLHAVAGWLCAAAERS
jgi:hypothetical protein